MKCHICNQEMRITKVKVIEKSAIHEVTEETWRCDRCDGWRGWLRRLNDRAYQAIKSGRVF